MQQAGRAFDGHRSLLSERRKSAQGTVGHTNRGGGKVPKIVKIRKVHHAPGAPKGTPHGRPQKLGIGHAAPGAGGVQV
jgi:hypothetical protein